MAKRGRKTWSLAQLEGQLAELNALRQRVLAQMKMAVAHLTAGSAASMAGLDLDRPMAAGRRAAKGVRRARRQLSDAARARLSQLAKARWAKARKEGKKRLG